MVAVTKTFPLVTYCQLLTKDIPILVKIKFKKLWKNGQASNRSFPKINLHLIGKLQTNKVKFVLPLFDYIHSLDNTKLASKIAEEQVKKSFKPKIFIQVNIGEEQQKSGIEINNLENFYKKCVDEFKLNIIGLMCIPPFENDSMPYFIKMKELSEKLNLKDISMGMSDDYMKAIKEGSTFIRVGSKIFGARG